MASFRYIHAESQWWKTIDANTLFACEMIQVFPSRAFTVLQILHFYPSKAVYRKFSLQDICIEHIALLDFFSRFAFVVVAVMAVPYLHHSPDTHAIQHDTSINFEYIEVKKAVHTISAKRSSPFALLGLHTKWPKVKRWRVHETRVIDTNTHKNSTANKKTIFLKKLILKSFFSSSFSLLSSNYESWCSVVVVVLRKKIVSCW